ncbi:unnamed protein product [Toxocara canis]|uniref:Flocculation protein FLO11-like n=1 Tax=Toxocara canis TaxID=6265 RepID=A0A183VEI6_TOXCA|nr:unnamed protein product [Toxocara canis]
MKAIAKDCEHPPPSPAPISKPATLRTSALRPPTSRLQPPSTKTSGLNNNNPSRCSSRSSSIASSATYSSIPSLSSVPSSTGQCPVSNVQTLQAPGSKMLKIKLFGGSKEKEKDSKSPAVGVPDSKNSKSSNVVSKSSGLMKPKASGLKAPGKIVPPSHITTKVSVCAHSLSPSVTHFGSHCFNLSKLDATE